jgi:hypothetical protein
VTAIHTPSRKPGPAPGPALWAALRWVVRALRTLHDKQMYGWECFWRAGPLPAARSGPLAWTPSLAVRRLTGSYHPTQGEGAPAADTAPQRRHPAASPPITPATINHPVTANQRTRHAVKDYHHARHTRPHIARPACAPAYYLGRSAHLWIKALHPHRPPTACPPTSISPRSGEPGRFPAKPPQVTHPARQSEPAEVAVALSSPRWCVRDHDLRPDA